MEEIETTLRSGSGPAPLLIAGAIADHIETKLAARASARRPMGMVAANLLALLVVVFLA